MPKALICRNPFRPQLDRETVSVRTGTRLDTFLRNHDLVAGRAKRLVRNATFIVQVNDQYLLQHQWSRRVLSDDILTVILLPGGGGGGSNPLQMVMMVAVAVASAYTAGAVGAAYGAAYGAAAGAAVGIAGSLIVNALLPPPKAMAVAAREQASPTYTIGAQGNRARLMEAIPCLYGRYRLFPDYAADPYTETDSNDQYVYQLFLVSQGRVAIEEIRIEDNPIDSYSEVTYQVAGPGEKITLFPDNVVTAAAVQGLEMKGPNEEGFEVLGPYATNPPGTLTDKIAVDIGWPQGIFEVRSGNKLREVAVHWAIEARAIDEAGSPVGGWFTLGAETFSAATQTPQIRTYRYGVTPGRYQVQARRQSNKFTDTTYANLLQWVGMRAYLPSHESYGDVTMLAVAIRATNNINQQIQRRVNVIATRMLQTWDPVNGWSIGEVATRNPAWALADVVRNAQYGRGLRDSRQNLFELHRLAQLWESRGDCFDGVFDTTVTLWDALTRIARVGRTLPMYYSGVIDYVRNEAKTVRRAMFSPFNMITQSFSIERKFPEFDAPDHIIVEYTDAGTWLPDEVVCALPGSTLSRPYRVPLPGVTSRDQAWREGMSMAASNRNQRKFISFTTSLEGNIPKYGDLVQVSHDIPAWGLSGFITEFDSVNRLLRTSEPLQWYPGENHYVALRRRDGSADGPHLVVQGPDDYAMRFAGIVSPYISDGFSEDPTHYQFGPGTRRGLDAVVISAEPDESGRVTLHLTNYAESVHTAEYGGAVPPPPPASLLPLGSNAPVVDGLSVYASPDPGYQIASATPARGAQRYEFQASSDLGASWVDLGVSERPTLRIQLAEGMWRVRVRGVGALAGPWKTWSGLVTATMAPPPALLALTATSLVFGIRIDWALPDVPWMSATEIFYSERDDLGSAINLGSFAVPNHTHTLMGLRAGQEFYFWARIRDVAGNAGPWYPLANGVLGASSANADLILDYIKGQISETELAQELLEPIQLIPQLQIDVGDNATLISQETEQRVTADQTLAEQITTVAANLDGNTAAIQDQLTTLVVTDETLAQGIQTLQAGYSSNLALIQNEQTTRSSADAALAASIQTTQASLGDTNAIVQQESQAIADLNGKVTAMFSVKVAVTAEGRLVFAGLGLGVENNNGILEAQVLVFADRFAVMHPNGADFVLPFVVQGNQVFINEAIIGQATITTAKISDAAITRAKIALAAIGEAQIEDAAIKRAKIGVAEVDYLRIAGQSATVWARFSHGGSYVDKSQANYQWLAAYNFWTPDGVDCIAMLNPWQDMASINFSYSKAYMFRIRHVQSGIVYEGIESASQPRSYGVNTGLCRTFSFGRFAAGDQTFEVYVKPDQSIWAGGIPGQHDPGAMNPDSPHQVSNAYSTTARFTLTILSAMR